MNLVDTHMHLYSDEFNTDREELIRNATVAGITRFFLPNIDLDSVQGMLSLCEKHKGVCFPMMGLHPCSVDSGFENVLQHLRSHLETHRRSVIAIGETGLDHYWDLTYKVEQEKAFRIQAEWASEFDLPIVIHSRNSTDALIDVLKNINDPRLKGVFHCFSGTEEQAKSVIDMGFYLGIGGVVTFKNGGLDKILPSFPMDKIILETDGPYLAPAPHRGKRNIPEYLRLVAEKIASLKSMTVEEVAEITTSNASSLFKRSVANKA